MALAVIRSTNVAAEPRQLSGNWLSSCAASPTSTPPKRKAFCPTTVMLCPQRGPGRLATSPLSGTDECLVQAGGSAEAIDGRRLPATAAGCGDDRPVAAFKAHCASKRYVRRQSADEVLGSGLGTYFSGKHGVRKELREQR